MNEVLSMQLNNHNCKILALEEEVDTLDKENMKIREELKENRVSLYSMQDQIDHLLSCLPTPAPQPASVHFEEPCSLSRIYLRSNAHSSGNGSFHSYGNNEDAQCQVPRHIMMTETILESSDNPMATPEHTRLHERLAASEVRFRASCSCQSPTNRLTYNTSSVIPNFKPVNLPKFDRKSNVTMFLWLYENTMYGADEAMKNSAIFNCLNIKSHTAIMQLLPERGWIFVNVSRALMEEFGSEEDLYNCKMDFVEGGIKKGETIQEFADKFYLEAQNLISLKAASFIDVKSDLLNTVQPNKNLSLALKYGIYGAYNVSELICHLLIFKDDFEVPIPTTTRTPQENRYRPTTAKTEKSNMKMLPLLLVLWPPLDLEHILSVENLGICPEIANRQIQRYTT
ncbi:hypothetical protein DSO57_1009011 [Entomophthora muscae]|uniref:Uncharacterized protein n=1 Tax=Entomophthora muscae TaxID=34485 RepID=A0ACC2UHJ9_9FUNG|nr:hypothetical protein DSO57_1009011 [Entomophthora muscae]